MKSLIILFIPTLLLSLNGLAAPTKGEAICSANLLSAVSVSNVWHNVLEMNDEAKAARKLCADLSEEQAICTVGIIDAIKRNILAHSMGEISEQFIEAKNSCK